MATAANAKIPAETVFVNAPLSVNVPFPLILMFYVAVAENDYQFDYF